jgi:beta-lactamase class A
VRDLAPEIFDIVRRSEFIVAGTTGVVVLGSSRLALAQPSSSAIESAAQLSGRIGVFACSLANSSDTIELNPDAVFPAASTIKVLIGAALVRAADRHRGMLDEQVMLHASDIIMGSPQLESASPGSCYAAGYLLRSMIVQSDNTASNALISYLGFSRINAVAADLGLKRTRLARHFADYVPSWRPNENVTSARDMGTFLLQLTRGARGESNALASRSGCRRLVQLMLEQEDRSKIPRGIPPGIPVANKSGELERVRNDIGAVDPFGPAPYVVAALTSNLSYPEYGDAAIRRVSRVIYGAFRS